MKRYWKACLASLAALVLLASHGAAATTQAGKARATAAPIATLAMDGARVAYASGGKVYVWNTATGAVSLQRGRYGKDIGEVAIAGKRVSWITRYVIGNSYETTERLFTSRVGERGRLLRSARRYLGGDDPAKPDEKSWRGAWIAGAVGSGDVLAVSTWWSSLKDGTCVAQRLQLIGPTALRSIATGPGAIVSESADSRRIAVLRSGEAWPYGPAATAPVTVGVYSASGALLNEITPSSAKEIALSGTTLVVLTETKTLEVYDWNTGALRCSAPGRSRVPPSGSSRGTWQLPVRSPSTPSIRATHRPASCTRCGCRPARTS